jgi:hypothetical protein
VSAYGRWTGGSKATTCRFTPPDHFAEARRVLGQGNQHRHEVGSAHGEPRLRFCFSWGQGRTAERSKIRIHHDARSDSVVDSPDCTTASLSCGIVGGFASDRTVIGTLPTFCLCRERGHVRVRQQILSISSAPWLYAEGPCSRTVVSFRWAFSFCAQSLRVAMRCFTTAGEGIHRRPTNRGSNRRHHQHKQFRPFKKRRRPPSKLHQLDSTLRPWCSTAARQGPPRLHLQARKVT